MFRKNEFNALLAKKEKSKDFVAELLGVNVATLYRKINGESDFTRQEIQLISREFNLSAEDITRIFFADGLT